MRRPRDLFYGFVYGSIVVAAILVWLWATGRLP